jgi:hypothetical protein
MAERDGMAGDPQAALETALIEEFLHEHHLERADLRAMPPAEARRVAREAAAYATARLTEVEMRAHYVHEIHDTAAPAGAERTRSRLLRKP